MQDRGAALPRFNRVKTMAKKEKITRKLTKTGRGSMYVVLPKEYIRELGWREKQNLVVTRIKGGLVIRDHRSKK